MEKTNLKQGLIEKVESYFNENDYRYEYDETYSFFRAGIGLNCKLKSTRMLIRCLDTGISYRFPVSINTDDENEIQVMEFVTRANCGLINGSFRMDLDDNTIEYYIFLPCEDVPSFDAIERSIMLGVYMLSQYGDELLTVMFGMKNAKDAVEAVESKAK